MTKLLLIAGLVLALVASSFLLINRPRKLVIDAAPPDNFPATGFSHASFETLLGAYVDIDGRVDYARWHEDSDATGQLASYLAAVARYSPDTTPARFPTRNDELAYWMYGYNAYVIRSVLDHWPLDSVTDVKAPLEAVTGMGFFFQMRYSFGGEYMSLLRVENSKIRKGFKDPRIHFVLNCASESCPAAIPGLPVGDDLDTLLTQASVAFVNDPQNVLVDHEQKTVRLSKIFKWYQGDFVNDVRRKGGTTGNELLAWLVPYASDTLASNLRAATDYKIAWQSYDWDINAALN